MTCPQSCRLRRPNFLQIHKWACRSIALVVFFYCAVPATAHDPRTSWTNVYIMDGRMRVELTLAHQAVALLTGLDESTVRVPPGDEALLADVLPQVLPFAQKVYRIEVDGDPLGPVETDLYLSEESDYVFLVDYPYPQGAMLQLEAAYLHSMSTDHTGSIDVYGKGYAVLLWEFLDPEYTTVKVPCPALPERGEVEAAISKSTMKTNDGDPSISSSMAAANNYSGNKVSQVPMSAPAIAPSFGRCLHLGVKHILAGYDHLLFLAGLLIVCERLSSIAKIVTCFTVAHSITLGLAALDKIALPSQFVEPAIAATIVLVGVENLTCRAEPKNRWAVTFLFGLIHGFGFAGVFRELVGGASVAKPLFAFNLGVELGQMVVVVAALPVLWQLRRFTAYRRFVVPLASLGVALMGTLWLIERIGS